MVLYSELVIFSYVEYLISNISLWQTLAMKKISCTRKVRRFNQRRRTEAAPRKPVMDEAAALKAFQVKIRCSFQTSLI